MTGRDDEAEGKKGTKGTEGTEGTEGTGNSKSQSLSSPKSFSSLPKPATPSESPSQPGFIPKHGGYQKLYSYQKSEIVYDGTVSFCNRFYPQHARDRTRDQMIQAARSGKQNIAEGSMASGTSKEMEIKLTNVARASLEELLIDYQDFLRTRGLPEWAGDHP